MVGSFFRKKRNPESRFELKIFRSRLSSSRSSRSSHRPFIDLTRFSKLLRRDSFASFAGARLTMKTRWGRTPARMKRSLLYASCVTSHLSRGPPDESINGNTPEGSKWEYIIVVYSFLSFQWTSHPLGYAILPVFLNNIFSEHQVRQRHLCVIFGSVLRNYMRFLDIHKVEKSQVFFLSSSLFVRPATWLVSPSRRWLSTSWYTPDIGLTLVTSPTVAKVSSRRVTSTIIWRLVSVSWIDLGHSCYNLTVIICDE